MPCGEIIDVGKSRGKELVALTGIEPAYCQSDLVRLSPSGCVFSADGIARCFERLPQTADVTAQSQRSHGLRARADAAAVRESSTLCSRREVPRSTPGIARQNRNLLKFRTWWGFSFVISWLLFMTHCPSRASCGRRPCQRAAQGDVTSKHHPKTLNIALCPDRLRKMQLSRAI